MNQAKGRRPIVIEHWAEYRIWIALRNRCTNPKNKLFCYYGARGITVSPEWNTFEIFLADMGPRPSPRHSIDRKNVNGPYAADNCYWATPREQANNRRTNRYIEYNGQYLRLIQWAEKLGIDRKTLHWRLANWNMDRALNAPIRPWNTHPVKENHP